MARKKRRAECAEARSVSDRDSGMAPYLARFLEASAREGAGAAHRRDPQTGAPALHLLVLRSETSIGRRTSPGRSWSATGAISSTRGRRTASRSAFSTQQQRLIPIKAFFQWLARENYILSNPA